MSFDRTRLPEPLDFYEAEGLTFRERRGKWRTTSCSFHGGRATMRINSATGAFACMAGCGARGGDVLAYRMAAHGEDFATAAKALGAWVDDGKPAPARPTPIPARDAIQLIARECNLIAVAAGNLVNGVTLTETDLARVLTAAGRVNKVTGIFT